MYVWKCRGDDMNVKTKMLFIAVFLSGSLCHGLESNIVGYTIEDGKAKTVFLDASQQEELIVRRPMQRNLHAAEILSFSTTMLEVKTLSGACSGTGFFYSFTDVDPRGGRVPAIFTNKHVIEDALEVRFLIHVADLRTGKNQTTPIEVRQEELVVIEHPDPNVDLCCFLIGPQINKLYDKGFEVVCFEYDKTFIPSQEYMEDVTQLDSVIMIGYPSGIRDRLNDQPIFRRGTLATNPNLDFDGKKEFLVDMPIYWGSSGSPLLLYSEGCHFSRKSGVTLQLGTEIKLIGINYATCLALAHGELQIIQVPIKEETTAVKNIPLTVTPIPNSLGVIIKSSRILEIEKFFWYAMEKALANNQSAKVR